MLRRVVLSVAAVATLTAVGLADEFRPTRTLVLDSMKPTALALTPDGKTLLVGGSRADQQKETDVLGEVRLFDVQTGKERRRWTDHESPIRTLAVSPEGKSVLVVSQKGAISLRRLDNATRLWTSKQKASWVRSVSFRSDGSEVALCGRRESGGEGLLVLDMRTGASKGWHPERNRSVLYFPMALSTRFDLRATGNYQDVDLWDAKSNKLVRFLPDHRGRVRNLRFLPDGKTLLVVSVLAVEFRFQYRSEITLWDVAIGKKLRTLKTSVPYVQEIELSRDGRFLGLVGTKKLQNTQVFELLSLKTDKSRWTFEIPGETHHFPRIALTSTGAVVAIVGRDGKVRIEE